MRILFDHNVPVPLRSRLTDHVVETAYERGWAELTNGELLREAESAGFEVLITTDQRIQYQQNLASRKLAIVVFDTNDWTRLRRHSAAVADALSKVTPGCFLEIEVPGD